MEAINRYKLRPIECQEILMPIGAKILSVQTGEWGEICLWAMDNCENKEEKRTFALLRRGQGIRKELRNNGCYLGTCIAHGTTWHVLEIVDNKKFTVGKEVMEISIKCGISLRELFAVCESLS